MILRELFAWCWQVGIVHLLISIFSLSLWDIFPILSSVVYYCEVFYLFWVQCLSQWLGCNFLIVEGVLPVAGVLHGQNLVQHHGKPGHSECLWWGSIPGEQPHPTPPHFTSKKRCSELKDCQVKKFNYSLTSTFFFSSCVILFCSWTIWLMPHTNTFVALHCSWSPRPF